MTFNGSARSATFLMLLVAGAAPAAQRWEEIRVDSQMRVAIDLGSIRQVDGLTRVWFRYFLYAGGHVPISALGSSARAAPIYSYELVLKGFDCKQRTIAVLDDIYYDASDTVVGHLDPSLAPSLAPIHVVPESTGESDMRRVCAKRAGA